ncbi:MAG TPA: hypothetical protein QF873_01685 [Patescibacteria group bacterium]|nr:hypothetical protein [Patescibacteria group bacterium]
MGLASVDEIEPLRYLNVTETFNDGGLAAEAITLTGQDLTSSLPSRQPSYNYSQTNFNVAFILLSENGSNPSSENISTMEWIANNAPAIWNESTWGRSTMNNYVSPITPPITNPVSTPAQSSEDVVLREKERFVGENVEIVTRTIGRILLQVEEHGEAWYVEPTSRTKYYLQDGVAAFSAMRNFGLGITNTDLEMIPVGLDERFTDTDSDGDGLFDSLEIGLETDVHSVDSDGDGFSDLEEVLNGFDPNGSGEMQTSASLVKRLLGRIVLQVEKNGEAWYINPSDGKRYYMPNGNAAYDIMRFLGLGITNNDLSTIPL